MVFWPARDNASSEWFLAKYATIHSNPAARALSYSLPTPSQWWYLPLRSLAIVATAKPSGSISLDRMLHPRGKQSRYLESTAGYSNGKACKDHNRVPLPTDNDLYDMGQRLEVPVLLSPSPAALTVYPPIMAAVSDRP